MKIMIKVLFLLLPAYSFSQIKVYNSLLKNEHQKVLYRGLNNIIKISGNKKKDVFELYVNGEPAIAHSKNEFIITAGNSSNCILTVYCNKIQVAEETFTITRIPDLTTIESPFKLGAIKIKNETPKISY